MVTVKTRKAVFIHSPELERYPYPPECPFNTSRAAKVRKIVDSMGLLYPCLFHYNSMPGISVIENGFGAAWEALRPPANCLSCLHPCGVEMNLLCSLNYAAILNWTVKIRF